MAKKEEKKELSFIEKILSIFGSSDPEAEKKRQLKLIEKDAARSRFKFYKAAGEEVLPAMAKFFYEVYKIIAPAQMMLKNPQASGALRLIAVENAYSDKQKDAAERLSEASILERAKNTSPTELSKQIKDDITVLMSDFDSDKVTKIDFAYSMLLNFSAFVSFDFFFLLKKFDSNIQERNFNYLPKFEAISSEYVHDDLENFISVAWAVAQPADWGSVFSILKAYKGIDPIALNVWTKLVAKIGELRNSRILEMILQLIAKNPKYEPTFSMKSEHIVDAHLEKIRTQAELLIKKIQQERTNSKADEILKQLFNTTAVVRLKNYSEQGSAVYERKTLGSYKYVPPLNYLKAFLIDYFKKDIREIADLVLVRGKWTVQASANQMSDAYHTLLEVSNKITTFDDSLAEESDLGSKLKTMLPRAERDKEAGKIIRTILRDINDKARAMLTEAAQNFIVFAKNLKSLLEDKEKTHPELLLNWKELDHFTETPVRDLGVDVYKKIFLFISLMQIFLAEQKESE